jgi:rSAM/selenodomain-associated transferase 2
MISIVIPVFNEASINKTLKEIRKQTFTDYEIIVVDGKKNGNTIKEITNTNCTKLISKPGRAIQMNIGAQKAVGDILLFLHADSSLPKNGLLMIDQIINSGINVGAFDIFFDSKNYFLREIISRTSSFRGRITRFPYGDQGQFFRKELFFEIGGYKDIPIMEDIEIMQRLKQMKERIFIIPHKMKTSTRRWEEEGILFVMLRNPILSALYFLGVPAEKLSIFYPRAKK